MTSPIGNFIPFIQTSFSPIQLTEEEQSKITKIVQDLSLTEIIFSKPNVHFQLKFIKWRLKHLEATLVENKIDPNSSIREKIDELKSELNSKWQWREKPGEISVSELESLLHQADRPILLPGIKKPEDSTHKHIRKLRAQKSHLKQIEAMLKLSLYKMPSIIDEVIRHPASLELALDIMACLQLRMNSFSKEDQSELIQATRRLMAFELMIWNQEMMAHNIDTREISDTILKAFDEDVHDDVPILDFSGKFKNRLPYSIGNLMFSIEVDLSSNHLTTVPTDIQKVKNLHALNLSHNHLNALPEFIKQFKDLERLNLSQNQFTYIPSFLSQLVNIRNLHLSQNLLDKIPEFLTHFPVLEYLDLSGNQLREIPNSFEGLEDVNLSHNQLTQVPTFIVKCPLLMNLNLSNNQLTEVPEFNCHFEELETLNLSNNPLLHTLPKSFANLRVNKFICDNTRIPQELILDLLLHWKIQSWQKTGETHYDLQFIQSLPEDEKKLIHSWLSGFSTIKDFNHDHTKKHLAAIAMEMLFHLQDPFLKAIFLGNPQISSNVDSSKVLAFNRVYIIMKRHLTMKDQTLSVKDKLNFLIRAQETLLFFSLHADFPILKGLPAMLHLLQIAMKSYSPSPGKKQLDLVLAIDSARFARKVELPNTIDKEAVYDCIQSQIFDVIIQESNFLKLLFQDQEFVKNRIEMEKLKQLFATKNSLDPKDANDLAKLREILTQINTVLKPLAKDWCQSILSPQSVENGKDEVEEQENYPNKRRKIQTSD